MKYIIILFAVILCSACWDSPNPPPPKYGAHTNPTGDTIGGGGCYSAHITDGDYVVTNRSQLLASLDVAQEGEIVFINTEVIDLSGLSKINISQGVTLAGNRGDCQPNNEGPLLLVDSMPPSHGLFNLRKNSRVTGLRLRGPDADIPDVDYDKNPPSWNKGFVIWGDSTIVDNCEISNFHHTGISVNNVANNTHIHHNYLHDIHAYNILCVNKKPSTLIEANTIEWIWEGIAGTGHPGSGYEARYNIFVRVPAPDTWQPYQGGHSIDMHPYRPVKQERGHLIGGDLVKVHHNTFISEAGADPSVDIVDDVYIRGVPRILAEVNNNCFLNSGPKQAVRHSGGNVWAYDNLYGPDSTLIMMPIQATPQILFRSPPPPDADVPVLSGESLSVDIEINLMGPLQLDSVFIELDGEEIYSGPDVPGELDIALCGLDTSMLYHELTVIAVDDRGVVGRHLSAFKAVCE